MTREHIQALIMLFLLLAALFAGVGLMFYAIEHIWLFVLMVFCLVCGLAMEKGDKDEK